MTAGFGIERLGLLALRFPRATLLTVVAILPFALYGASQLTFSSDVREIFRSATPEFATLDVLARDFPETERDLLLVIEGEQLFQPRNLEALRSLHLDLSLSEDVGYVLSMFSAREPPQGSATPKPIFPADLEGLEDTNALRKVTLAHPLVADKLLSKDASLAIFVIALKDKSHDVADLRRIVGGIKQITQEALKGSGLHTTLTGLAVMRIEIIGTLIRDQRVFILAGVTIGLFLFWLVFRRLRYSLIAGAPAATAMIWLLGAMWLTGQEVNVLTNIVPAIVMVLVFSDTLHLLFAVRRNLREGLPLHDAIARSVRNVGPACVLTSLTTMLALLSLMIVAHPFITRFGLTAAIGCGLALLATLTVVPALCALTMRKLADGLALAQERSDPVQRAIDGLCGGAANMVAARPRAVALAGVLITVLAGGLYALNAPSYRYSENLPQHNPAIAAIETINAKLAGSNTARILIEWPQDHALASLPTLDAIRDVEALLLSEPIFATVSSLHGVEQWLSAENQSSRLDVFRFLRESKTPLTARFISYPHNSALVTAYFANPDASELVPVLDRLKGELAALKAKYPDATFTLTGIVPLSAWASHAMIWQLNRSLLTAIGVIIVLIGLALRSLTAALVSILPNLLPIAVGGAYLYLSGKGLQFTSVVAFTIGFGIAVDSTIHVLNRYRLALQQGEDSAAALKETVTIIGPVVIVSTLVLAAGMASTLFSEMPMLRLFGTISVIVLTTALIGDLLFLPAIIATISRWRRP